MGLGGRAILFGLLIWAASASAGERRYYFDSNRDGDRGLVQHTVNAFFQDRAGFMWIATQGGLHKYDGYRVRVFEHSADDPESLPSSFVSAITQDASGAIWVGTRNAGIARVDPVTGKAKNYAVAADRADAQTRNAIIALKFDPTRGIWVVTAAGIELLDPANGRRLQVAQFRTARTVDDQLGGLVSSADGSLWAATPGGVWRIAAGTQTAVAVAPERIPVARSVLPTRDGKIFVGTPEGLMRLDVALNDAVRVWPTAAGDEPHNVFDVVEDAQGKIWMAVFGSGLAVYEPASGHVETLSEERNVPGTLPEKFERRLFVDRSGLLWVGGINSGFATTDPLGAKFRLILDIDPKVENPGNYVRALEEDAQGRLWLATAGADLKRYDRTSATFSRFADALLGSLDEGSQVAELRFPALQKAEGNSLWVATGKGVVKLDPDARHATRLVVPSLPPGWTDTTRAMLIARDGSLWLGSAGAGLAHGRAEGGDWQLFKHRDLQNDTLADDYVVSLDEDSSGRVWIGTTGGLTVYDPRTKTLRSFHHVADDPHSLSDNIVHSVHECSDGTIWIGTHSGLNRAEFGGDGALTFTRFLTRDGLLNATIYSIIDDSKGNLWLGTNRGIQLFDRQKNTFHAFTLHDGLQGMEYNTDAVLRLADGEIAFGGADGVNVFRPETLRFSDFVPPVVVTGLQIGDAASATLAPGTQTVRVAQTERILRFEFAALDYAEPSRNRFAYQLVDFDKDWVDAGTRSDATYTNLPAGNYQFRVRSSNHDDIWNSEIATLGVTITPPWWSSLVARLLYAAAAAALLYWAWFAMRRRREDELRHHAELRERDERFRMALWGSGDEFWDLDMRTQTMHRIGADQSFGGSYEETLSDDVWLREMTHPEDVPLLLERRKAHIDGRSEVYESEHRVRGPDNEWAWRLSRGKIVEWDAEGKPLRACGTARNVTQAHIAERQHRIAVEVLNSMNEAVCVTDLDHRFVSANQAFVRMSGYAENEIIGQTVDLLHSARQPAEAYLQMRDGYLSHGHWRGELWQRRKTGEEFLCWLEVSTVRDHLGRRTHYVSVMTDITERKRNEQDLRYLANYDTLTGLPNRSLLIERLVASIDRASRNGERVAVLFLDLDHFKHVNDSMGHSSGDLVLRAVGERLRTCVGESDIVARLGGDEFTLLIEGLRDIAAVENVAKRVIRALSSPLDIEGARELVVTTSIGVSVFPDHARGPMSLLKFADTAMYQAKEQGRNTYAIYTEAMDIAARRWADTAAALRRAVENRELHVVYQPKLTLATGKISGVEALLRWRSPELGEIPPSHFIPLAEQTGLIVELGNYVIRTACTQLKAWRDIGLDDISIAINVSVLQLLRGELAGRLRRSLAEYDLDPALLELELTETMLMARAEQAVNTLDELKAIGVSLAIDDFGTGYSSLSYLKRLPIDTLKIDASFVRDISTDPDDRAITATIIRMAQSLQLTVVAEGVETQEQFEYLRDHGCQQIQGHWLARPLSAEACTELLRSGTPSLSRRVAG